jgi:hypothetical protein
MASVIPAQDKKRRRERTPPLTGERRSLGFHSPVRGLGHKACMKVHIDVTDGERPSARVPRKI